MATVSDEPLFHDATLLDAIPTMIWITGSDQQARFFNRAWLQFTGQTLAAARHGGWVAGIHPVDVGRCLATYQTAAATQQPFELEYRRCHYNGEYCWHLDRATPHFDADGRWLGYIGTAIDITDRKLAEIALSASEEKFAKAFNASPLIITISQLVDGRLVEVNDTFVQLTGYTRDEVLGRTPVELGLWVEPSHRATGLVQLQAGHALRNSEARFRMKDGQERTCLVAAERLELNGQACVLTVLTDITQRQQAEAARQVSETRYRALFETTSDAIFIGALDGTYLDVNPAATQLLGVAREQLIGAHYSAFIPPDWQAQATVVSGMMRASGQWAGEFPMRRADGTLVWAEYRTSFDGQYIVGVARDVTAQKQAAAETARLAALVQAERERLASLIASVPGVVWESWGQPDDQAQRIDFVSDYVETLLGYSKAEWLATPNFWLALVHPQDKIQAAQTAAAQFHSGGGGTNQFRWLTKDGRVLDCEAIATVIHDATGQPIGMRGITFDRTALKQSEEAYKRSAARYRALVEASSQAVWSVDLVNQTGDFTAMQHWWGELTGQSPAAIANQGWLQVVHEADRERVQRDWNELLATGASYYSEYQVYGRDGRTVYLLARAVPVRAADGTLQELVGTLTDVTEARLAEQTLREREANYRALFEQASDGIFITNDEGIYVDVNAYACELSGYTPSELIGKHLHDLTPPADWPRLAADRSKLVAGRSQISEWALVRKDGQHIPVEVNVKQLPDGRWQAFVRDMTARYAADAAFRENEARFRAAFEQVAVGMAQISPESQYLRVNARLCEITGYDQDALLQKTYQEITDPEDLAANVVLTNRLFAGELPSYTIEKRYRRPDGAVVWVNVTASAVHDAQGTIKYQIAVIEDISARKLAEAELRFLAETSAVLGASLSYAATLQQVAALMVPRLADLCTVELVDPEGGITPVAVVHSNPTKQIWVQTLRQQYPPQLDTPNGIGYVLQTGRSAFYPRIAEEQLLAVVPDATYRRLLQQIGFKSVLIVPLQVRDQILGTLTLARTETDQPYREAELHLAEEVAKRAALAVDNARLYEEAQQAERQLRRMNETLEQRVQARTAELERRNRDLDQFAYIASHDLRSPLRAIDQLASWISQDARANLPAPSQIHLDKLRGRIKRMETLLQDLLTYSRAGRQRHAFERVDVAALVHDIGELLGLPVGFGVTVIASPPPFVVERVPLETVLRNLIGNALKHHDHPETGHVQITAQSLEDWLVFTVSDDGPGIAPAFHTRIFDLFQTLKPRDQVEGSGMGLAVVKKLVESRGGIIEVSSSVGQGATFRFTWPQVL